MRIKAYVYKTDRQDCSKKSIQQETEVRWESDEHSRALGCAQVAQKGDLLGLRP